MEAFQQYTYCKDFFNLQWGQNISRTMTQRPWAGSLDSHLVRRRRLPPPEDKPPCQLPQPIVEHEGSAPDSLVDAVKYTHLHHIFDQMQLL